MSGKVDIRSITTRILNPSRVHKFQTMLSSLPASTSVYQLSDTRILVFTNHLRFGNVPSYLISLINN